MRGADPSDTAISGFVSFEQSETAPLGDITVEYSIEGLPADGEKGFHVHQFGDTRITKNLTTMAAHFVPFCIPENPTNPAEGKCADDQVHGLPPDQKRQPGDMGNINVANRVAKNTLTLSQGKMSLTDAMRSIVGRVVVVHSQRDDGSQPYGNAGGPLAYGVIGLGNPTKVGRTDNGAQAPTVPKVDKIACTFDKGSAGEAGAAKVTGVALLTLQEPCERGSCKARMQAKLFGMAAGAAHSFHFHQWGDMTVDWRKAGELGEIYESQGIKIDELEVLESGEAQYDATFDIGQGDDLRQHVGRSLTVHEGPEVSSPTIAAAACGIANPLSKLDTGSGATASGGLSMSTGVVVLTVISSLVFIGCLAVGCLFFFGGSRSKRNEMRLVPPPPPRPVKTPSVPPPTGPPPDGRI